MQADEMKRQTDRASERTSEQGWFYDFIILCIVYSKLARSLVSPLSYVRACFLFIICWLWCAWASKDSFWIERHVSSIKKEKELGSTEAKKAIFVFIQQGQNEEHREREIALAIFGTSFKCYNPFVCVWFNCCSTNLAIVVWVGAHSSIERMEKHSHP